MSDKELLELYLSWEWKLGVAFTPSAVLPSDNIHTLLEWLNVPLTHLEIFVDGIVCLELYKETVHECIGDNLFWMGNIPDTVYFSNYRHYVFFYMLPHYIVRSTTIVVNFRGTKIGMLQIAPRYVGRRIILPCSASSIVWIGDIANGPSMIPREWILCDGSIDLNTPME